MAIDLFTYSYLAWIIPAGAIAILFAYAFILWATGDRVGARNQIFNAIAIGLTMMAIAGAYIVANIVANEILGRPQDIGTMWYSLGWARDRFEEIYRKAVDWIVYLGVTRGMWGLIPYVGYPISEGLGAATLWQNWVFSITSTTFLGLRWFTEILMWIHPWLLTFGAGLAATPRFRTIGGVLLAIYLVAGASIYIIASISNDIVFNQYGDDVNKAPEASNVGGAIYQGITGITTLAGDADRAAQGFMWATVIALVGTLIMGVLTAGVSRIFEGIPVLFRPI